ncbi:hypothetical protein HME9302_01567 [Alteripontixanthobacter maritimus]|uniref:PepSY domain-containing protein n=1 Tax=Alteripontixanthobacter maritimus TaxID=2161824 RepID=A0A369Q656_9SPHN|nr:PepSY domain-containing protein [Alteripontixanthobacter maritimus]RDC60363.1 hypothetical protein HME9302_01567 [Alteripontixanthobacter maritimus]
MKKLFTRSLAATMAATLAFGGIVAPASAQPRTDQGEARKQMRAGKLISLRTIENRVRPMYPDHKYLGPSYDSTAMAYRLKFMKDGKVTYVDVDARTGRILRRWS